jgi:hypothetical protein
VILLDQLGGGLHRELRIVGVVGGDQLELPAERAAATVQVVDHELRAAGRLDADLRARPGQDRDRADLDRVGVATSLRCAGSRQRDDDGEQCGDDVTWPSLSHSLEPLSADRA